MRGVLPDALLILEEENTTGRVECPHLFEGKSYQSLTMLFHMNINITGPIAKI
jgi:hypothetical protein